MTGFRRGGDSRFSDQGRRPGGPRDPRFKALLALVFAIVLAVLFAYVMGSLQKADDCLAMGGRNCG